jgi:hypothetical protein
VCLTEAAVKAAQLAPEVEFSERAAPMGAQLALEAEFSELVARKQAAAEHADKG